MTSRRPRVRARALPGGALALLLVALAVFSCTSALERAASSYRQAKLDTSLDIVARSLHTGMPRVEVERLLGPPDYSPIDGQYYYASNRGNHGLVVEYRIDGRLTDQLQDFTLGPILE